MRNFNSASKIITRTAPACGGIESFYEALLVCTLAGTKPNLAPGPIRAAQNACMHGSGMREDERRGAEARVAPCRITREQTVVAFGEEPDGRGRHLGAKGSNIARSFSGPMADDGAFCKEGQMGCIYGGLLCAQVPYGAQAAAAAASATTLRGLRYYCDYKHWRREPKQVSRKRCLPRISIWLRTVYRLPKHCWQHYRSSFCSEMD
ncbi:hypothetical protein TARUN_7297 [Trichoderma arundinaceum]|uniref:Uncharacterized protein n=1 Tax=Trichoderma arundinaceum TaxID=490622 RepID=A0A395NFV8_TRIAR|nr:hypothetical protein TARUN_7297 [Trichoderma arundinaceum]